MYLDRTHVSSLLPLCKWAELTLIISGRVRLWCVDGQCVKERRRAILFGDVTKQFTTLRIKLFFLTLVKIPKIYETKPDCAACSCLCCAYVWYYDAC